MTERPKVIGIGFHKTGTTSLRVALEELGYRVTGPNATDNTRIALEVSRIAFRLLQKYDAVQDNPWPLLFKEIDDWYPGSKFILTIRSTERWIKSVVDFFGTRRTPMREWIYGAACPLGNEEVYIARYERHNQDVLEYFSNRPEDLLVMDITKGDGWEKLCPFLNHPVRLTSFPHANAAGRPYRSREPRGKFWRRVRSYLRDRP